MEIEEVLQRVEVLEQKIGMLEKKYEELLAERPKLDLDEFFKSSKVLAIHCSTLEQSKKLLDAFDTLGKTWENGDSYLGDHRWMEAMIYLNNNTWGLVASTEADVIYEFEEVALPERPKWKFTKDEKTILKSLPPQFEYITRDEDGKLAVFDYKPQKEEDGKWQNYSDVVELNLFNELFIDVDWSNEEPCPFRQYI